MLVWQKHSSLFYRNTSEKENFSLHLVGYYKVIHLYKLLFTRKHKTWLKMLATRNTAAYFTETSVKR